MILLELGSVYRHISASDDLVETRSSDYVVRFMIFELFSASNDFIEARNSVCRSVDFHPILSLSRIQSAVHYTTVLW